MKKKMPLYVKIILAMVLIPVILIGLIIGYICIKDYTSTASRIQRVIKAGNIKKLEKIIVKNGVNTYYGKNTPQSQAYDLNIFTAFRVFRSSTTPLGFAIQENNLEVVNFLIKQGADVNLDGFYGDPKFYSLERKPISLATLQGNKEIAELLIKNGADINAGKALNIAAREGNKEIAELLIKNGADIDAKAEKRLSVGRETPLMSACKMGRKEIVELLIKNGADVNAKDEYVNGKDEYGETALMYAAKGGHTEIINLLKSAGAKNDILAAVLTQDLQSVKEFIKNGADLNKKYDMVKKLENGNIISDYQTLLSIAKEKSSPEIVELLIANGAKE